MVRRLKISAKATRTNIASVKKIPTIRKSAIYHSLFSNAGSETRDDNKRNRTKFDCERIRFAKFPLPPPKLLAFRVCNTL